MINPHVIEYKTKVGEVMTVLHDSLEGLMRIADAVKMFNPDVIIELGTMMGGMTAVFHEALPHVPLYTFDLKDKRPKKFNKDFSKKPFNENVHFIEEDVLTPNQKIIDLIKEVHFRGGRVLLYCDNGKKVEEIKNYGPYLKRGDLLGHHDFIREYSYADIEDVLIDFCPHPINRWLMENGHSDRFWIKGG